MHASCTYVFIQIYDKSIYACLNTFLQSPEVLRIQATFSYNNKAITSIQAVASSPARTSNHRMHATFGRGTAQAGALQVVTVVGVHAGLQVRHTLHLRKHQRRVLPNEAAALCAQQGEGGAGRAGEVGHRFLRPREGALRWAEDRRAESVSGPQFPNAPGCVPKSDLTNTVLDQV